MVVLPRLGRFPEMVSVRVLMRRMRELFTEIILPRILTADFRQDMSHGRGHVVTNETGSDEIGATRRDALRTIGASSLAFLALAGMGGNAIALGATPVSEPNLEGSYAIVRVRRVKPAFSATDLAHTVIEGFGPIVRDVPGYIDYFVVPDEPQRIWVSIGIFANKAGADESTVKAIAFGKQGTHDWVEGDPIIIAGVIDTASL